MHYKEAAPRFPDDNIVDKAEEGEVGQASNLPRL